MITLEPKKYIIITNMYVIHLYSKCAWKSP